MSDFLKNFSNDKYHREDEENIDENVEQKNDELQVDNDDEQQTSVSVTEEKESYVIKKRTDVNNAFSSEQLTVDNDYHKYKFKKYIITISVVVVLIIVAIVIYFATSFTVAKDFVGETEDSVVAWQKETNVNVDYNYETSNEVSEGDVISQNFESGELIWRNDMFSVTISNGPDLTEIIIIPDFTDKTSQDIKLFIDDNNLINADIKSEKSSFEAGKYIRTEYEESMNSTNYTRDGKITFYVSDGETNRQTTYVLPDFTNQNKDKIEEWKTDKAITVNYTYEANGDYPVDYVIKQNTAVGTKLNFGDEVTFVISKGVGKEMPSFWGLNDVEAQELATDKEINVSVKNIYSNNVSANNLISQSIASGERYFSDDKLTLTYSLGKPYIDNFEGQALNSIVDQINSLNKEGAKLTYNVYYRNYEGEEMLTRGQIISTSVYGQYVNTGTHINIYVAK